jgi:SepF-like predicted cell division protein (DUF552 family)
MPLKDIMKRVKKVGTKVSGKDENINVEEYLSTMDSQEEEIPEEVERYVKSLSLDSGSEIQRIEEELLGGSLLIVNTDGLQRKSHEKLKEAVGQIKEFLSMNGGDIARITPEKLLITPKGIKIQKKG